MKQFFSKYKIVIGLVLYLVLVVDYIMRKEYWWAFALVLVLIIFRTAEYMYKQSEKKKMNN